MLPEDFSLNRVEKRVAFTAGGIYTARMLGLFMALPVLALADGRLDGATPVLIGLALGIHGLSQALLQIPFGALSDVVGRKPVIVTGLLIFVLGSVVAAAADTIFGVIAGRALQGAGAVAAAMMALVSDLAREEQRSRILAFIGAGIGAAFMLGLILGPPVEAAFGLGGIFAAAAALGVLAIVLTLTALPTPPHSPRQASGRGRERIFPRVRAALGNAELLRLNAGVFFLHLVLTANFLLLPPLLQKQLGLASASHWLFYAPLLIVSFALILPLLKRAEKTRRVKGFFLVSVALLGISQSFALFPVLNLPVAMVAMLVFFAAFNYLEASLPALVSRFCDGDAKGTSMGVFANGQFLGAFVGGALAGWVLSVWGSDAVYLVNIGIAAAWFLVAAGMRQPSRGPVGRG